MDNFKKINTITRNITSKIFKRYNYKFVCINEEWLNIVGKELYDVSIPIKMSKEGVLIVKVKSNYVINFEYSLPLINKNIREVFDNDLNFKIKILQEYR